MQKRKVIEFSKPSQKKQQRVKIEEEEEGRVLSMLGCSCKKKVSNVYVSLFGFIFSQVSTRYCSIQRFHALLKYSFFLNGKHKASSHIRVKSSLLHDDDDDEEYFFINKK